MATFGLWAAASSSSFVEALTLPQLQLRIWAVLLDSSELLWVLKYFPSHVVVKA